MTAPGGVEGRDDADTPKDARDERRDERRAELRVAAGFGVSAVSATALAVVYAGGGQPQAEGVLLALSLGGLAYGFAVWAERLLPGGGEVQKRETLPSSDEEREAVEADLERQGLIGRRKLLTRTLAVAGAALGAAFLFPIRSLGPGPGRALERTSWRPQSRLVDDKGRVVRAAGVPVGAMITVFPEGHIDAADSQTVLIRVEDGLLKGEAGGPAGAPPGFVAYSKVCTHAGCPVGLYQADTHQLLCPCHQSAFDVLDGARPVFGPATRSLPRLALEVDPDGVLRARGDFDEPVGPAYWRRT